MEDKREDLVAEKQKKLLFQLVEELSRDNADLYYAPTTVVARTIRDAVKSGDGLNQDQRALLEGLSTSDIQVILSLQG